MTYVAVAVIIRSLVEGLQKVMAPVVVPEMAIKAVAFVLSAAGVFAYGLNPLAEVGLKSQWPAFDLAAGSVIVWYSVLGVHDFLDAVKNAGTPAAPKG